MEAALSASIDPATGTFLIDTPRTCGGFAEGGAHTAGALRFDLAVSGEAQNTPASVWASSLDGEPLATSRRILVTHLTDVQNTGIEYADPDRTTLLKWGRLPHLMRNGAAEIELTVEGGSEATPPSFAVYRLSPGGKRLGKVPFNLAVSGEAQNTLRFTALIDYDPTTATYLYEIVRQ